MRYAHWIGIFLLLPLLALANPPPQYSHVVAFGDSLTDIGNNTWVRAADAPSKGAPITNKTATDKRPLWINFLLQLGTQKGIFPSAEIQPYAAPLPAPPNASIDFAWASAETVDGYTNDSGIKLTNCDEPGKHLQGDNYCVPGLRKQVQLFLKREPKPNPKALYIIWSGGDDLFDDIALFVQPSRLLHNLSSISLSPAKNIATAVGTLIKAGIPANHIVVLGLPSLNKVPAGITFIGGSKFKNWLVGFISKRFDLAVKKRLKKYKGVTFVSMATLMQKISADAKTLIPI